MELSIKETITDKFSGEWGEDAAFEEGVKVIRTANFTNLGIIDYSKIVFRNVDAKKIAQKKLRKGDIIIEKSGGSPTQPVGRVVFFEPESDEVFLCNNFTSILRPNKSIVYPKYLFYQLFIGHIRGKTLKYQNKTTGIINLKLDNYLEEKINIPLLEDQIRIATILSKVETLIRQRKESIDLLDVFLKSTFLKMFGDPLKNEKNWDIKRLEEITTKITDGKHGDCENEENSGYYFISAKDLVDGKINYEGVRQITEKDFIETHRRTQLKLDDVLIGNTGASIGKIAIVTDEEKANRTTFQKSIAIVTADNINISSKFLMAYLIPNREYLEKISTGSGQKNLLLSQLRNLKLIIPPLTLQNQFAQIAEKTEILKTKYKTSLKEFENLFASLSQKAFKGELDLLAMQVLVDVEEYQSYTNDRTEPHHFERNIDLDTVAVKVVPNKKTGGGEPIVAGERLANLIKKKYSDKHFSFEMLVNFIKKEKAFDLDKYFSSEEIKANPKYDETEDLKVFLESAVVNIEMDLKQTENINPWLKLNQHFYNAKTENISLTLTKENFELIKNRTPEERSGIYFNIVS